MPSQYAIGIDLGTTNSVLAYTRLGDDKPQVSLLPVPQLVAAATVERGICSRRFSISEPSWMPRPRRSIFPGRMAIRTPSESLAVKQAADVPTRTVSSAKSWLAHSRVDRHQSLLPWDAPPDVAKVSPVEASRRYLQHLVAAWTAAFPDAPIAEQQVVLTVPASFDASARELTREAALLAGLPHDMVLLEEPQAALYAWLADMGDAWRRKLNVGDTLLVCDIGGGTTDFTLIGVSDEGAELSLRRIAVGNHTLVGGDNMDLAIAHSATTAFAEKGAELNPWQSVSLWHSCRAAKETLLGEKGPKKHPVAVAGPGKQIGRRNGFGRSGSRVDSETAGRWFLPQLRHRRQTGPPSAHRVFARSVCRIEADTAITGIWPRFFRRMPPTAARQSHARSFQRRRLQIPGLSRAVRRGNGRLVRQEKRSPTFWKATPITTTPSPAAQPITAPPSAAAASAFAAGRRAPITSASKPPAPPSPAPPGRFRRCASFPSAWRKEPKPTSPAKKSAWSSAKPPSSASSAPPPESRTSPAI